MSIEILLVILGGGIVISTALAVRSALRDARGRRYGDSTCPSTYADASGDATTFGGDSGSDHSSGGADCGASDSGGWDSGGCDAGGGDGGGGDGGGGGD